MDHVCRAFAVAAFGLLLLCLSCAPKKIYVPVTTVKTVTIRDTTVLAALPALPAQEARQPEGKRSVLENLYARSTAEFSNGELHHTLESKPAEVPVTVPVKAERIEVPQPYPVEVSVPYDVPLAWWDKLFIRLGQFTAAGLVVSAAWWLYRRK